jgi:hypothetical protein
MAELRPGSRAAGQPAAAGPPQALLPPRPRTATARQAERVSGRPWQMVQGNFRAASHLHQQPLRWRLLDVRLPPLQPQYLGRAVPFQLLQHILLPHQPPAQHGQASCSGAERFPTPHRKGSHPSTCSMPACQRRASRSRPGPGRRCQATDAAALRRCAHLSAASAACRPAE